MWTNNNQKIDEHSFTGATFEIKGASIPILAEYRSFSPFNPITRLYSWYIGQSNLNGTFRCTHALDHSLAKDKGISGGLAGKYKRRD